MNLPKKHHFLPVFYLSQWAGNDGKIVRFTKPYRDQVVRNRVHPDAAGYLTKLYAVEGFPEETVLDLEREFLSPVDSKASEALRAMLRGEELFPAERIAWAGFMSTLLFRMPDDIEKLRENVGEIWDLILPGMAKIYQAVSSQTGGPDFSEFKEKNGKPMVAARVIEGARRVMADEDIVRGLANLEWSILTVDKAKNDLLTSDRPVIHTNSLNHPETHLLMPIGPRRLFVGVKDRKLIAKIKSIGEDKLVQTTNSHIVGNAKTTVCGRTESQLRFVQNRMGKQIQPSLMDRLKDFQRNLIPQLLREWELGSSVYAGLLSDAVKSLPLPPRDQGGSR
ncbi:hypothetical protein X727_16810 [Mesorhizobium sp. L103C119B0]|uniref:DUF4238 domain-containing protein n=1 Tax=Mesorhizobium sp. L103C119B0 TaxID=1287085 RepID=UPI0003D00DD9|nr:DUF4238 domain-containing protein [Mesorhizobium sp. L103C119B0]ESZ69535.1 hypothetical protein X727_16810 [Mesorhizobium sp. L103C119B0]